jgi:hypothetical protein
MLPARVEPHPHGTIMGTITLSLRSDTLDSLRRDYDAFVKLSTRLDADFLTPSFEDFLRAKLLDSTVPLTEQAVQRMLQQGQYAWAKRTLAKDNPEFVAMLMSQAGEYGFALATPGDWSVERLTQACRDWAAALAADSGGDAALVDSLATQIRHASRSIQVLEEEMQTASWRLADSLRQRIYEAKHGCETSSGGVARERFGELRGLLRLALQHGAFRQQDAQQIIETLILLKPELLADEPRDIFSRCAAWLRALFFTSSAPAAPRKPPG